jgi:hypothetical protein
MVKKKTEFVEFKFFNRWELKSVGNEVFVYCYTDKDLENVNPIPSFVFPINKDSRLKNINKRMNPDGSVNFQIKYVE